ncbi:MAG TPA: tetratricopeptide repeat protein [Gammaproteobacteria bacterium]|nr:tetratricopeptide repeat protein [Gammaproteobacteria bacterium]
MNKAPAPTEADFIAAVRLALRYYHEPDRLRENPLVQSRLVTAALDNADAPRTPVQALREVIRIHCEQLGSAPKADELRQVIQRTWLKPMRSQQAVAETLNLSWSTYRRRLASAVRRLAMQLWEAEAALRVAAASAPAHNTGASLRATDGRYPPVGGVFHHTLGRSLLGALALIALSAMAWLLSPTEQGQGSIGPPPDSHSYRRTLAVLPFENLSADKANGYFAAGIRDELLTRLAAIPALKVIARTSTARYKSHPADIKSIAADLNVAAVLEGSVQKAGDTVHINVQLIDARTYTHLWAHSYDRKLTDIFGVEGEVANKIAAALGAELSPAQAARLHDAPTASVPAYDRFLRGEYYANRAYSSLLSTDFDAAIKNYQAAVRIDPRFALAYAKLSLMQSYKLHTLHFRGDYDPKLAAGTEANADKALALAPDLAEAHLAEGYYLDYVRHDLEGQLKSFQAALALAPESAETLFGIGVIYENRAHFRQAIDYYRRALVTDPRNLRTLVELAAADMYVHRYKEAETLLERGLSIDPASVNTALFLVSAYVLHTGDIDRALAVLKAAPAAVRDNPVVLDQRAVLLAALSHFDAARRLFARLTSGKPSADWSIEMEQGDLEWFAGDKARARDHYRRAAKLAEAGIAKKPNSWLHERLGWIFARLGKKEKALQEVRRAVQSNPADSHPVSNMTARVMLAQVEAQLGETDQAVAELGKLLAMPSGYVISIPLIQVDPNWAAIRSAPGFQALVKQYDKRASRPDGVVASAD